MYGYIYLTTNLTNNKIYIGQKHSSRFLGNQYLGSGKLLRAAVKKHGPENFTVKLLEEVAEKEKMDEREIYWIAYYHATDKAIGYNISEGGNCNRTMVGENNPFFGKQHSEETIKKIRAVNIGKEPWNKGKTNVYSAESLKLMSEAGKINNTGKNNPMFGKKQTEETKAKIREKKLERDKNLPADWIDPTQTEEARAKRKASLKGHAVSEETRKKLREFNEAHCWVHNEIFKIQVEKTELSKYLELGFILGTGKKPSISKEELEKVKWQIINK